MLYSVIDCTVHTACTVVHNNNSIKHIICGGNSIKLAGRETRLDRIWEEVKKSEGAEVGVGSCCVGSSIICAMCRGHGGSRKYNFHCKLRGIFLISLFLCSIFLSESLNK